MQVATASLIGANSVTRRGTTRLLISGPVDLLSAIDVQAKAPCHSSAKASALINRSPQAKLCLRS